MFVILGVELKENKKVRIALQKIHGIGKLTSEKICDFLSINHNIKISDLSEIERNNLSKLIKENLVIENVLRREVVLNIEKYKKNNSYRGFRHRHNLPVRGQRTCTNAKTRRKMHFN